MESIYGDIKQIRSLSFCKSCIYANWENEMSDEQDWFWCDLQNVENNEPLFVGVDECEDLDTGIDWP